MGACIASDEITVEEMRGGGKCIEKRPMRSLIMLGDFGGVQNRKIMSTSREILLYKYRTQLRSI